MNDFVILKSAGIRIDNIYQTTLMRWGEQQAKEYIEGLFHHFEGIVSGDVLLKPIPAEFEVEGYVSRYEKHFVYSRILNSGRVGIATILQQRMHQVERFSEDFTL
jgi:toxin ParE1/3/4